MRRIAVGLFILLLMVMLSAPLGLVGSAQQTQPSQPEIVFPGDAKFAELESKLQEKTKLSGSAWVEEFKKRQVLGQVRGNNGLQGILFADSVATINVLTGQVPFIVYGTIAIPVGSKLGSKEIAGTFGIVIFTSNGLVLTLIDVNSGSIGAFIVLPVEGQTIVLAPLIFPFFSPVGIFQVLFSLITVPTPTTQPPTQPQIPQLPVPTCPADLSNKSDLNVPLGAQTSIVKMKDSAGTDLFEIGGVPPGILTVQSFGASLQFQYVVSVQRRTGFIIGPGTARILLSLELPFALLVTNGVKTACVQATPKVINGIVTIVGTLATN